MPAHHWLNGLGSLVGVVKGDRAHVMVKNVGFDDAMKKTAPNETKFTVNGRSCATGISPRGRRVVGKGWVGVLEERDGHCER